jgi:hypothetical protein
VLLLSVRGFEETIMTYMMNSWLHAKDRNLISFDAGFAREVRESTRPQQIAYVRIMGQHDGDPSGVEFRHHNDVERWAFVLADASVGGMRIQMFDTFGFSGHQCYGSLIEAVEEMVKQGYHIKDAGALDRISLTPRWAEGMAWMEMIQNPSSKIAA